MAYRQLGVGESEGLKPGRNKLLSRYAAKNIQHCGIEDLAAANLLLDHLLPSDFGIHRSLTLLW
jgi:hypothetical protein